MIEILVLAQLALYSVIAVFIVVAVAAGGVVLLLYVADKVLLGISKLLERGIDNE